MTVGSESINVTQVISHTCSEILELTSQSVKYDMLSLLLLPVILSHGSTSFEEMVPLDFKAEKSK